MASDHEWEAGKSLQSWSSLAVLCSDYPVGVGVC